MNLHALHRRGNDGVTASRALRALWRLCPAWGRWPNPAQDLDEACRGIRLTP